MQLAKPVRAAIGIALIGVLFFVVLGFWNRYQASSEEIRAVQGGNEETTATATSGASKDDGDSKSAEPASKNTVEPKKGDKVVVVQIQGLNFRKKPSPDGEPIRGLDDGDTLLWVATEGSWYKVRDAQSVEGYVSANEQYTKLETAK